MASPHPHTHPHSQSLPSGALDRRLQLTIIFNITITVVELAGGLVTGSLALIADATHNFSDVVALVLARVARRLARRPPTARHTYGLKRAEVVAAFINATTLIGITVLIAREAISRLLHPEPVAQGVMLVVASTALVVNLGSVFLLRQHEKSDVNLRGAFLHMLHDALASLAVVVAALLAGSAWGPYVDGIAALLVGLVVLRSALSLAWETLSAMLDSVPVDIDLDQLAASVARQFHPVRLHHLHVWQLTPMHRLMTAHVTIEAEITVTNLQNLLIAIKEFLRERWHINHATLEPEWQRPEDPPCQCVHSTPAMPDSGQKA